MNQVQRPEWAQRMRDARLQRGLTSVKAAEALRGLDPTQPMDLETVADYFVKRWESGKHLPDEHNRQQICLLYENPALFDGVTKRSPVARPDWRDVARTVRTAEGQAGWDNVVRAYATRGEVGRPEWNRIISGSTEHLWLYGMAEAGFARDDTVPGIVADAVTRGCEVRVLLLNPDYERMAEIDEDERSPGGTLAARIRVALRHFEMMREASGPDVQIRVYNTHPSVSVVRGDDRMLVTPYVRYFSGSNSPTFELRDGPTGKMFERYGRHVERAWACARDWAP